MRMTQLLQTKQLPRALSNSFSYSTLSRLKAPNAQNATRDGAQIPPCRRTRLPFPRRTRHRRSDPRLRGAEGRSLRIASAAARCSQNARERTRPRLRTAERQPGERHVGTRALWPNAARNGAPRQEPPAASPWGSSAARRSAEARPHAPPPPQSPAAVGREPPSPRRTPPPRLAPPPPRPHWLPRAGRGRGGGTRTKRDRRLLGAPRADLSPSSPRARPRLQTAQEGSGAAARRGDGVATAATTAPGGAEAGGRSRCRQPAPGARPVPRPVPLPGAGTPGSPLPARSAGGAPRFVPAAPLAPPPVRPQRSAGPPVAPRPSSRLAPPEAYPAAAPLPRPPLTARRAGTPRRRRRPCPRRFSSFCPPLPIQVAAAPAPRAGGRGVVLPAANRRQRCVRRPPMGAGRPARDRRLPRGVARLSARRGPAVGAACALPPSSRRLSQCIRAGAAAASP